MEHITLGDLTAFLEYIIKVAALASAILVGVNKVVKKLLRPIVLDNAKNYLVPFLSKVERGEPYDDIEMERFHEEYELYTENGGNSYIKSRVDKLKKEGKL